MGSVVTFPRKSDYDQFPLIARYRSTETGSLYEMYIVLTAFVVVEVNDKGKVIEHQYTDSDVAGLGHWLAFIRSVHKGTAEGILLDPEGIRRMTLVSVVAGSSLFPTIRNIAS